MPHLYVRGIYSHECRIRDCYADHLASLRPCEVVSKREVRYAASLVRADLRTLDESGILREWEFKLRADYSALGQILCYTALAKREFGFDRRVQGVIAAFEVPHEIRLAVNVNNLGIEFVEIPRWMRRAGAVPEAGRRLIIPHIPRPTN